MNDHTHLPPVATVKEPNLRPPARNDGVRPYGVVAAAELEMTIFYEQKLTF